MGTMRGPAVHDFSASIWPRVTKSGIQLPYDHPPRGILIYFEITIFIEFSTLEICSGLVKFSDADVICSKRVLYADITNL